LSKEPKIAEEEKSQKEWGWIITRVIDAGIGVDKMVLNRLFKTFTEGLG